MQIKKSAFFLLIPLAIVSLLLMANVVATTHFEGHFEGLFLFKDNHTGKYLLTDHLFVGKEKQLKYAIKFSNSTYKMVGRLFPHHKEGVDHLHVEWNPKDGSGFVSNYFANGTGLVTYLGRYLDDEEEVHGLFVGGGLPETVESNMAYNMNNSGMTYYDGKRWYHIWCSVNEGIANPLSGNSFTPSKWKFLGSRVEKRTDSNVIITSSHLFAINDVPLKIDRKMSFAAGEPYLNLDIKVTNTGTAPVSFIYLYGDEPWVGYYGTSLGDVGWTADGIVEHETFIDTKTHSFIGMADLGNRLIGERPVYTNLADFIEWPQEARPDKAYFVNDQAKMPQKGAKVPLESNERFLGLEWLRTLQPAEATTIRLAIGMAPYNPASGTPQKPATTWKQP
ncbi:MAG: hypothetical protein FIA91_10475 [Geobacter sp.]|nr:hypothetical protein [Geobacter sp.]